MKSARKTQNLLPRVSKVLSLGSNKGTTITEE